MAGWRGWTHRATGSARGRSPASAHRRTPADSTGATALLADVQPTQHAGTVLDAWLDLVTGSACVHCRRPGRLLCPTCRALLPVRGVGTSPDPCPPGLAPAVVGGNYADPLRAMVLAHKEHRAFALARPLGEVLAVAARDLVAPHGRTLLVPVPSRAAVVAARGHDPMLRITRHAAGLM